jgi:quinol monooxygenase YgiN
MSTRERKLAMSYLIVRHTVEDYAKWKKVFDEEAPARRAGGGSGGTLFRDVAHPNEITVVFQWKDVDSAKAFAGSAGLREAMTKAGVIGAPTVQFVDKVEDLAV